MEDILSSIRRLMAEAPDSAPINVRLESSEDREQRPSVGGGGVPADLEPLELTVVADVGDELDLDELAAAMLDAVRERRPSSAARGGHSALQRLEAGMPAPEAGAQASERAPMDAGDDGWVELEDLLTVAEETFGAEGAGDRNALDDGEPEAEPSPSVSVSSSRPASAGFNLPATFRIREEDPSPEEDPAPAEEALAPTRGAPSLFDEADDLFSEAVAPSEDDAAAASADGFEETVLQETAAPTPAVEAPERDLEAAAEEPEDADVEPVWPGDALEASATALEDALESEDGDIDPEEPDATTDSEGDTAPVPDAALLEDREEAGEEAVDGAVAEAPPLRPEPISEGAGEPTAAVASSRETDPRNGPTNEDLRRLDTLRKKLERMAAERIGHKHEARAPDQAVIARVGVYDPSNRAPADAFEPHGAPELDFPGLDEDAAAEAAAARAAAVDGEKPESDRLRRAREVLESGETPRDLDVTPGPGRGAVNRAELKGMMEELLRESLEGVLSDMMRQRGSGSSGDEGQS